MSGSTGRLATAMAVILLVVTACGDDGGATTTTTTRAATTTSEAAQGVTIVGDDGIESVVADTSRIVSLSGDLTEIIFALGAGDRVAAVDVTTTFPEQATGLPVVGFGQELAPEPVLAFAPTLVLANELTGPAETIDQIRGAGIPVVVKAPAGPLQLSPAVTTTLFRIVQEAVSNVVRHAEAGSVTIVLEVVNGLAQLRVQDDGRGFDPDHASRDEVELQRLGLLGIRERAEMLGGHIQIDSALERGTTLRVSIPVGGIDGEDPHFAG